MNVMEKHTRVAIYIRVSTKLQEDKYSLRAQQEELTTYALKQGWEIIEVFKDVDSGAKLNKPGLESLLDCVEDGLVDIVLVIEQDRLSRLGTVEWEFLKDVLRRNDVKIAEPGNITDLTDSDDEFISDLKNLFAQRSRRDIKFKMNRGFRQYVREGKIYGRQPDEYDYNKVTKELSINENRAWIIPFIDKLYLEDGFGYHRIATALNRLCKTSKGAKWSVTQVKVRLTNKAYHGVLEKSFSNGETIAVENVYPPLRTKETFEKIQLRMQESDFKIQAASFHHALRQLKMVCSCCGRRLSLAKGNVLADGHFNVYVAHGREYAIDCIADPYYNANQILLPLYQLVKSILFDDESIKQYMQSYQKEIDDLSILEQEMSSLQSRIEVNSVKIDKLLDLYLDGSWSKERLDENKNRIVNETEGLTSRLTEIARKVELIKRDKYNVEAYLEVIGDVEEYLAIFRRMDELNETRPVEMDSRDQEQLIKKMFDLLEIDGLKNEAVIYGKSIENVPITFSFKIDEENIVAIERLRKKQFERYLNTQQIIDAQPHAIGFMELKRLTGLNVQTLNEDAALFGNYKNLKLKKGSEEKKTYVLKVIKECLAENFKMPAIEMAKRADTSAGTVLRYIREYNLRPGRAPKKPKQL